MRRLPESNEHYFIGAYDSLHRVEKYIKNMNLTKKAEMIELNY